jgi:hypothetical protein
LPDGYAVKKGDMVNYQPYQMGRMRFLWGADAEEFRPERWLDDAGVFVPESPFKFTAFQVKSHVRRPCSVLLLSTRFLSLLDELLFDCCVGGPSRLLGKGIRVQADEDLRGCASLPVQV